MTFDVVTIFPRLVDGLLREGILARAVAQGIVEVNVVDLRDFAHDAHRVVDDVPFGGGPGMVLKAEPMLRAVSALRARRGTLDEVILPSPQGRVFDQTEAARLATLDHVVLLCGRYEGVDERVREAVVTSELSIGDYVLSGGELPALVILDAVARLRPGVVGDAESLVDESFARGLLDYPHYTRPAVVEGRAVPEVLRSGHHARVRAWRKREAVRRTLARRPDLLDSAQLDDEERAVLDELRRDSNARGATG